MTENINTAAARRAQQAESDYTRALRELRQAKEAELAKLDERHKVIRNAYNMKRVNIKEDFALKRLNLKTDIERLRDKRATLRHALSVDADVTGLGDVDEYTTQIHELSKRLIALQRQETMALQDEEGHFEERCKENQEERRALNRHFVNQAEQLHEQYLAIVEQNRQQRLQEEGGAEA